MTVTLLTEHYLEFLGLNGGCTVTSESTLVKMPQCWKSHVMAQLCIHISNKTHWENNGVNKMPYNEMGHVVRKSEYFCMRTTKIQTNLRIRPC